ncbi:hypothetical protein [Stenotrophomonas acidaminiphila]|uniref:hypothetical protein n=2 Tax=Lysobacteraceae TaxID=32033 RepID=UPI001B80BD58|nr:hypothetical protein [Stenotrophomonas acidaminiphila]
MNENKIKPIVALCLSAAGRYWSTTVAVNGLPLGDYYDQAAIDRLTAELAENEAVINVWRGRTQRAEAERDALRVEAMLYREVIEYALAQHSGRHTDVHNHWAAKAMNELAAIDAAHAKELRG